VNCPPQHEIGSLAAKMKPCVYNYFPCIFS
jgi:hypothetical protein